MKLSIIVPVYNVEQYIRPCVESIFRQELDDADFEVILVNDGTPDNSFGVIRDIINSHSNIRVVEQDNQGLSAARNTGMDEAIGDYLLFLDSDDLLVDNSIRFLVDMLVDNTVDLLVAEFVKMTNAEIANNSIKSEKGIYSIKSGSDIFLNDFDPRQCYVWRTLYRKEFLVRNNITFIPGIYFEDVPYTSECYLKAQKCIKSKTVFYIYRQRENSIVSSINMKKLIDMNRVVERLWDMRNNMNLPSKMDQQLTNTMFATFSIAVWYIAQESSLMKDRRTFIKDIKTRIPNLMFLNGIKQIAVSVFFRFFPNTYILLCAWKQRRTYFSH